MKRHGEFVQILEERSSFSVDGDDEPLTGSVAVFDGDAEDVCIVRRGYRHLSIRETAELIAFALNVAAVGGKR